MEISAADRDRLDAAGFRYDVLMAGLKIKGNESTGADKACTQFVQGSDLVDHTIADPGLQYAASVIHMTAAPAGATVCNLQYNVRVAHSYVHDLTLVIRAGDGTELNIWNRQGSSNDGGLDDDSASDADIEYAWRTTSAFNGSVANQTWYLDAQDWQSPNAGSIDYFELKLYYTTTCDPDAYESDGSFAAAKTIACGDVQSRSLCPVADADYVKFTLTAARVVTLTTDGALGTNDTEMWLYNSSQQQIAYDDDSGYGYYSQIQQQLAAGTYYALVRERGDNSTIAGYTLALTCDPVTLYSITGRIRSLNAPNPGLGGIPVGIVSLGVQAVTDACGNYTLPGIASGSYSVCVLDAAGFSAADWDWQPQQCRTVQISGANATGIDFTASAIGRPVMEAANLPTQAFQGQPFTFRVTIESSVTSAEAPMYLDVSLPGGNATLGAVTSSGNWTSGPTTISAGSSIWHAADAAHGYCDYEVTSLYPLISAQVNGPQIGIHHWFDVTVTPTASSGTIVVQWRGTLGDQRTPESGTQDQQQGWYVNRVEIPLSPPLVETRILPGSFASLTSKAGIPCRMSATLQTYNGSAWAPLAGRNLGFEILVNGNWQAIAEDGDASTSVTTNAAGAADNRLMDFTGLGVGQYSIRARFAGDATYGPCVSAVENLTLTKPAWLFLVYLAADNNLESAGCVDFFQEMTVAATNSAVSVCVLFDRNNGSGGYGSWTDTRLYWMTPDGPVWQTWGERNMADPQTLSEFIAFATSTCPADKATLVLWDHGDGWSAKTSNAPYSGAEWSRAASADRSNTVDAAAITGASKAVCWDYHSPGDSLRLAEVSQALSTWPTVGVAPLELLGFDACLMSNIEVAAQVAPFVDLMVASEDRETAAGYDYQFVLDAAHLTSGTTAVQIGQSITNSSSQNTMALWDLRHMPELETAISNVAGRLLADMPAVRNYVQTARRFALDSGDLVDIGEFMTLLADQTETFDPQLATAADYTMTLLAETDRRLAFWCDLTSHPYYGGLSIGFPPDAYDPRYDQAGLAFLSGDQLWDDFLRAYHGVAQAYTIDLYVAGSGHGTITKSPDQASYAPGTIVQLTAVPDAGYRFGGWTGDATGTSNPIAITMDADKAVMTSFMSESTNLWTRIPAGVFVMGDGQSSCGSNQRTVTLSRDFVIGQYEVTNQQYLEALQWAYGQGYVQATTTAVTDNIGGSSVLLVNLAAASCEIQFSGGTFSLRNGGHGLNPHHPMKWVTWYGAAAYCDWLSMQAGLQPAYNHQTWQCNGNNPYTAAGYRLPTDAEWEYAAQFDDERIYPWGGAAPTCSLLNFAGCVGWTMPVGSHAAEKTVNGAGLFDMAGNVLEWCNDRYTCALGTVAVTDPAGPTSGATRLFRGGSYGSGSAAEFRCSYRGSAWERDPASNFADVGFRCARTASGAVGVEHVVMARSLLGPISPNPFNPMTEIAYEVRESCQVSLRVYDLRGRLVCTLLDQTKEAGQYTVRWNGRDDAGVPVVSGVYLCRMQAGAYSETQSMTLLR